MSRIILKSTTVSEVKPDFTLGHLSPGNTTLPTQWCTQTQLSSSFKLLHPNDLPLLPSTLSTSVTLDLLALLNLTMEAPNPLRTLHPLNTDINPIHRGQVECTIQDLTAKFLPEPEPRGSHSRPIPETGSPVW